ncbi:MAG TPA: TolC family protein, partial [Longimicrobiales bacterium]|nr:TolC family protein [Longimicrobiales bacterium]
VGLQFPMFANFFQNRQAQAEAAVEVRNREEQERETRMRVEETVRSALLELQSQWESLRLAERSGEIAQEALRLAQEEYRIGGRTFEDLRQSIDAEADTRRQVIQARHSFVDALLSLDEAVGARVTEAGVER